MGCDAIQQPPPFFPNLSELEPAIIRSELVHQGQLTKDEARKVSEEELRERAQGLPIILHDCLLSKPFKLSEKSPHLMRSELVYRGRLTQDQARTMSEEYLRELAEGMAVRLHYDKDYHCVEYYPLFDMSRDARNRFLCYNTFQRIARLTCVELQVWEPEWTPSSYRYSLVIMGSTQESVERARGELDTLKESTKQLVAEDVPTVLKRVPSNLATLSRRRANHICK
ncbi:hypothetical protein ACHQM5_024088 [Ranunculus cassubicifolius]